MKRGIALAALAGVALAIALVVFNGFAAVTHSLLEVGWGLLGISLYHLLPMTLSALGWRSAVKPVWRAHWSVFAWARAVREAAANLLPVLQVGGDLIGARVLTFHNASAGIAGASVVVDLTLEVFAQFLFTLLGLTILFAMDARSTPVSPRPPLPPPTARHPDQLSVGATLRYVPVARAHAR